MEGWGVAYVLRCFRALVNVRIDESKILELITELAEGWKNLAANTAPTYEEE
jgi:hypothetical protein